MLTAPPETVRRARRLRREMSWPEIVLWRALRQRPGGYKFRKQHPAGFFVLDFFCAEARLAIEIDGAPMSAGISQDSTQDGTGNWACTES